MSDAPRPGRVIAIESHANPRLKAIRALSQTKARRETGQFLVEGLKLVADALEEGWTVRAVICEAGAIDQPAIGKAAASARARGADILTVNADMLGKISRRDNPQTVLGIVDQKMAPPSALRAAKLVVALERAKDPGNLGTIVRTADAVGADAVIVVGPSVDPFATETVRATMGSIFHIPLVRMSEDEFLAFRSGWTGPVVGTHLSGAVDYRAADYDGPVLLLMGNEQTGLSDRLSAACDILVRIPMAGRADSLNLAVATGVMLYEIGRKRLTL